MIDIVNYEHRDIQTVGLANRVGDELHRCVAARGQATLAVPGGRTPLNFFKELSTKRLAWENITVILTDEYFVPEDSEQSNFHVVSETLKQNFAQNCNLISFLHSGLSPDALAQKIGKEIKDVFPIDVCVLGMGLDMHTASFVPNTDRLDEALKDESQRNVISIHPNGHDNPRITLTAPIIASSKHIHLLIFGRDKRIALGRAIKAESVEVATIKAFIRPQKPLHVHFAA